VVEQMLSPVLVRRDDELSVLEDALLSAARGIAVGPAILAKGASDDNIAVRGTATNLAARLQAAAGARSC
jgi:class 3 adenylate cyclase